jgi:hypothetical protein
MALGIDSGTLPVDGTSVDPAAFLETWISSVNIYNFGAAQFKGAPLNFVYTSTDPPALADRQPGMLWFKRGEGRLYVWDYSDAPSAPSSANTSDINWMSLSDRRDIWLQSVEAVPPGTPMYVAATPSGTLFNMTTSTGESLGWDPYFARVLFTVSAFAASSSATGIVSNQTTGLVFVPLETTYSGGKFRACEFGFCDALMGSGVTNAAGPVAWSSIALTTDRFDIRSYSLPAINSTTEKWSFIGQAIADATAYTTGAPYLRSIFKWGQASWTPTSGKG